MFVFFKITTVIKRNTSIFKLYRFQYSLILLSAQPHTAFLWQILLLLGCGYLGLESEVFFQFNVTDIIDIRTVRWKQNPKYIFSYAVNKIEIVYDFMKVTDSARGVV